ncbi:MAG: polysaccharide deacetylase family protein [Hespellia sp.]|nr:polysaccharide deacetylase family protein [Hespellia sp.]
MSTRQRHSKRKRGAGRHALAIIGILLLLTIIGAGGWLGWKVFLQPQAVLTVTAKSYDIKQEEAAPAYELTVTCKGSQNRLLDFKTWYTVKDFMKDIERGDVFTFDCDADTAKEDTYPITLTMNEQTKQFLSGKWKGKVSVNAQEGSLTVENKSGQWDGENRFKDWDGNDVTSTWITSKGNTYYFNADGNKVTGVASIEDKIYGFDDSGIMLTGWQDVGDARYDFGDDGAALIGWQDIDTATYYFNTDGQMLRSVTQSIDGYDCIFNEDGTLASKKLGSNIDPNKPMIAITFDDGPGNDTSRLLDAVEQHGIHVTFFMLGQHAAAYSQLLPRMEALGCELGNHSWDHPQLTTLSSDEVTSQVSRTNQAISQAVGHNATVLRPPYGATNKTVSSLVGLPQILWSIDTLDWKTKSKDETVQSILSAQDGDIVLLHDIHSWSVDAAIEAFPQLIAKGYQLVTVSEMARAKGVTLDNGGQYFEF